jgi:hypothetical protein
MTEDEYIYPMADESEIFATIPLTELQELIEDSRFLQALHAAGVDDWEWYEDTLETFQKEHKDGDSFFSISDPK